MKPISFHTFEQQIAPNTLKAGLKLFEAGLVEPLETMPGGKLEAQVWDGEMHQLQLHLQAESVQKWSCDCGNSLHQPCAHLTAVLFKLMAGELGLAEKQDQTNKKGKKEAKKTQTVKKLKPVKPGPADHLIEIISELPKERLVQMVIDMAAANPSFLLALTTEFAGMYEKNPSPLYEEQIQSVIKKAKGRKRSLSPDATKAVCTELMPTMQQIEKQLHAGANFNAAQMLVVMQGAISEIFVLIERIVPSFTKLLDSWRNLNDKINALAMHSSGEEVRSYIFQSAVACVVAGPYRESSMSLFCTQWAGAYCKNSEELHILEKAVMKFIEYGLHRSIQTDTEKALLAVYERMGEEAKAQALRLKIAYSEKERQELVDHYISIGDTKSAMVLLEIGLEQAEENHLASDHLHRWQLLLLELLVQNGQSESALERARKYYLRFGRVNHADLVVFLKEHVETTHWPTFKQTLLKELERMKPANIVAIFALLKIDGDLKEMLDAMQRLIGKVPDLYRYITYLDWEPYKPYAEQASEILAAVAINEIKSSPHFGHPNIVKITLKHLLKLGDKNVTLKFINELLLQFKNDRVITSILNQQAVAMMQLKAL